MVSPRAKKMGPRSAPPSQDEVTDTAASVAPTSQMSMARSLSRYKGNRRNLRSHEPPLPIARPSGATHRPPASEQIYAAGLAEESFVQHDRSDGPDQASQARNPQSTPSVPSRISRPRRGSRMERREESAPAEGFVKSESGDYPPLRTQLPKEDNRRRAERSNIQREASGGGGGEDLRRTKAWEHTDTLNGTTDSGSLRPQQDQGVDVGRATSPRTRMAEEFHTKEKGASFSQRVAIQHQLPQAFRNGCSREELKRMISVPIPTAIQEPVASPPRKQLGPSVGAPSHTSPELSLAPRFDAPISAVNAGQRIVRVKYEGTDIFLPITPSTTPVDVIRAAARQMSAPIDDRSTVLLESFKQIGLERPLRKYEHIRDVLNSWDNDAQNTLVIIPSPSGGKDDDLDVRHVSKGQPGETTVHLYHSQKPGSWDKRFITLRSDGQVVVAKRPGAETSSICHLSDFDIYIPTPRYASKKIKPPKKVCFAVKSQQKSTMFMTTENFVHFFCTSDRSLGTAWYTAVQEWRSWYLVHVMGEGEECANKGNVRIGTQNSAGNGTAAFNPRTGSSTERSIRPRAFATVPSTPPTRSRTVKSTVPPNPKKLTKDPLTNAPTTHRSGPSLHQTPPSPPPQAEPFEPASLLGRTYTRKQKALQHPPTAAPLATPPPMPATVARNDSPHSRTGAAHRTTSPPKPGPATTASSLDRHSSQLPKPKPLVDLTPVYQEPPQHSRKGRGVIPLQIPSGGLVEVATSPERAVEVPSATTWRKPNP